jgi:predicted cupin superfamily sugar epimerase
VDALQSIIARLGLEPLPREGGWFRQHYLSPERDSAGRHRESTIHFVISPDGFSALHRLRTAETWIFREGAPIELLVLTPDGDGKVIVLGHDAEKGQQPAASVPGGCWQGARPRGAWAWADCTMSPAWDEREFELGERAELVRRYPAHAEMICALTR